MAHMEILQDRVRRTTLPDTFNYGINDFSNQQRQQVTSIKLDLFNLEILSSFPNLQEVELEIFEIEDFEKLRDLPSTLETLNLATECRQNLQIVLPKTVRTLKISVVECENISLIAPGLESVDIIGGPIDVIDVPRLRILKMMEGVISLDGFSILTQVEMETLPSLKRFPDLTYVATADPDCLMTAIENNPMVDTVGVVWDDLASNQKIIVPPRVTTLKLINRPRCGDSMNITFDSRRFEIGLIPEGIERLFVPYMNHMIDPYIVPSSVKEIVVEDLVLCPEEAAGLPEGFNENILTDKCCRVTNTPIPEGTRIVCFDKEFNQPLEPGMIPSSVQAIIFHPESEYAHPIPGRVFPSSLRILRFGKYTHPLCHDMFAGIDSMDEISLPWYIDSSLEQFIPHIPETIYLFIDRYPFSIKSLINIEQNGLRIENVGHRGEIHRVGLGPWFDLE